MHSIALSFPTAKSPKAVALLVGRDMLSEAKEAAEALGGGWRDGIDMFSAMGAMPFALLIAPTPQRVSRSAPILLAARDVTTLTAAANHACSMLNDITCAWLYLSRDERACEAVRRVTLADTEVVGGAQ